MKIVFLDGKANVADGVCKDRLFELGEAYFYEATEHTPKAEIERIGDADIIISAKCIINREVIESCPNLKLISQIGTGYNTIDVQAATEHGIAVSYVPSYATDAVAQHAIALLLEICNKVGHHDAAVHAGRWIESDFFCFWDYPLVELSGKNMGVIGYGHIGKAVAKVAHALGMNILTLNRHPGETDEIAAFVDMDTLLAESDVVALQIPLTAETQGFINRETIAKMKDGAILLNNSRGALVVEQDLADALNSGKLAAAGLDVLCAEPMSADNPLYTAKNCVITPHISWVAKETRQRLVDIALENVYNFIQGTPTNIVNPEYDRAAAIRCR